KFEPSAKADTEFCSSDLFSTSLCAGALIHDVCTTQSNRFMFGLFSMRRQLNNEHHSPDTHQTNPRVPVLPPYECVSANAEPRCLHCNIVTIIVLHVLYNMQGGRSNMSTCQPHYTARLQHETVWRVVREKITLLRRK
ncbi:unnamed protein product, partial [Ectocarpus sp. 13 AM-2016]